MTYKPIDDTTRANMLQVLAQAGQLIAQAKHLLEVVELAGAGVVAALEAIEPEEGSEAHGPYPPKS